MIIEISVIIIALAFAALIIYLIGLIRTLQVMLRQMSQLSSQLDTQLSDTGGEVKKIVEHTNQVSADIRMKMASLNSLFRAVENVGDVLEYKTALFKRRSIASAKEESDRVGISEKERAKDDELGKIANFLELAGESIRLWQNLKKRR